MSELFVPADFDVPRSWEGPGFRLEPLGPEHNERDHEAWMSSIDHIHATPGFDSPDDEWPAEMSLGQNLDDLKMHATHFAERRGFTYSILDGDDVIGCVYIYPARSGESANVRSWLRRSRADMDTVVWRALSEWIDAEWPFPAVQFATRP